MNRKSLRGMATALRECFVGELIKRSRPVCFLPIIWGASPLPAQRCDCTCEDNGEGEGWIRVVNIAPLTHTRNRGMGGCGVVGWDVRVELGVWRCAPRLDESGQPPSDGEFDGYAFGMFDDVKAIQATLTCCDWFTDTGTSHTVESIAPSGPMGGCVSVIGTTVIRMGGCGC